ncbi:hypothetical protein ACVR1N_02985 [Streptococcus constellatus subsp. pharyngis]|uniref:Putative lipoprotein n=1 Tax=Streptococcus constellatus subsp. pharyngis SK1060 = CCUG 46377 TaxID=1035184 RepID=F9P6P1_STRCV|nr:hypothetical protein [Streptococcus constellatus]AGU72856.1 hypothetical protein SCRE_1021 [Streptococcus constellatus subsp. pharyngis C232]AGU74611.1 hypothetical protein SCR2_1021 [Streptococcus constellatus subsp. pharyngis C818]EGV09434.1 putative lipoprotein [Streptococcus constellatus subsp. pharyngis SK1060 = CCUG 46377]QRP82269.1 hypothetical protein I6J38_03080 [Streptococcus constellatus]GAD44713.1 hypothetical protein ANG5_1241 [Streptococcus constellatus subsp. pharyngis SK1060
MNHKKKYLLLFLVILVSVGLGACNSSGNSKSKSSSQISSSSKVSEKANGSLSSSATKKNDVKTEETQRVGSDDYGYIDIPKNWLKFRDVDGGDSIQYTDGSGYNIVTMNAYTKEKAKIQEREEFTAQTIANRIYYNWQNNKNVNRVWGSKGAIAGNEAYQVNVIMKSGQYLVSWIFKKDEKVYLIALEGNRETLIKLPPYIEKSEKKLVSMQ